jgi:hypothetical protein
MRTIQLSCFLTLLGVTACGGDDEPSTTATENDDSTGGTDDPGTSAPTTSPSTSSSTTATSGPGESSESSGNAEDSESDPGSTGTTDATSSESSGGGEAMLLQNTPAECKVPESISPILPDEAGHLAATTLTPSAYPFEVTAVAYDVLGTAAAGACNSTLAHRVDVFVIAGSEPPADPDDAVSVVSLDVAADPAATDSRTVEVALDEAIVLEDGQSLVVAVQMVGDAELATSLCLQGCRDTGGVAGLDWWSNAALPPYAWADMVGDFGFISNFMTRAHGEAQ